MRASAPRFVWPAPVVLWALLVLGHALALVDPVPALVETPARTLAIVLGVLSLAMGPRSVYAPRTRSRAWRERVETVSGTLAVILAGAALGAEADRAAWPLPVHPRETNVVLEGIVIDTTPIDAEPPSVIFEARRVRVGSAESTCRARLPLTWSDATIPPGWIVPGLWLRVAGAYRPPEDARNPGTSAPGRSLELLGLAGRVRVDPLSITAPPTPETRGAGFGAWLRDRIARDVAASVSRPVASLTRGMLLGDRSGIAPALRDAFRDGGTIHILSISGLHVCILAGFLALLASSFRLPLAASVGLELAGLWGYVALVGAPASALRSAMLWTAVRSGRVLGRSVRPFTAWGLAGLLLHLFDPASVLDPGFQLSFTAVLGLGASGPLSRLLPEVNEEGPVITRRVRAAGRFLGSLFLQSGGATAGTAGFQSALFGAVPIVGLFLNLAVIPLCTLFMAEALLAIALHATGIAALAQAGAGALDATGILLLELNVRGSKLLEPWLTPGIVPLPAILVASGGLLFATARAEGSRGERHGDAIRWSAVAVLVAALIPLAGMWTSRGPGHADSGTLATIEVLDIGQGDAAWVRYGRGEWILIDAGPRDESRDSGELVIEPELRAEHARRVPRAILSHAHLDHFGGFDWLARRRWIGTLFENGSDPRGAWRLDLCADLERNGGRLVPVWRDTTIALAGGDRVELHRGLTDGKENDRSLAAVLRVRGIAMLFAGDLESAGEAAVLPSLGPVALLKAPHHGSKTSSGEDWVERLRPRIVTISCGERNRFGHPDLAVLGRYRRMGALVLRTDLEGAIRITFKQDGAWVSTRQHPAPLFVSSDPVTHSTHSP